MSNLSSIYIQSKIKVLAKLLLKNQNSFVLLFFLIYLAIGLLIFDDYGISWDEPANREKGIVSSNYIFKNDKYLFTYGANEKGVVFELPLYQIEKIFNMTDSRNIYLMRHFFTFTAFYIGCIFFYLICNFYFNNRIMGLLGCIFLVLSPRIFAHSFYNSKDLVFLSFFIISIYTLIKFLRYKNYHSAFIHSFASALVIDIRLLGILVIFISFISYLIEFLRNRKYSYNNIFNKSILLYIFITPFFIILMWPYLWENPISNFINAFEKLKQFPWSGEVLFMGDFISASSLPWYYIPIWIAITTPIFYLINFIIGIFYHLKKIYIKRLSIIYYDYSYDTILLLWFFSPLVMVIVFKSTLYDGWRHLFFIYPAFIIISLNGFIKVYGYFSSFNIKKRKIFIFTWVAMLIINLFYLMYIMIHYHPHQNVYFNTIAGKNLEIVQKQYELDYWGLSYKQALLYILEKEKNGIIKINCANSPCRHNVLILKQEDRERIELVGLNQADYFLSNFRYSKDFNKYLKQKYPYKNEFFSIKVDRGKIAAIYKLK